MDEFNNRMNAQRKIIQLVNQSRKGKNEELYGLSKNAIERWITKNNISCTSDIYMILFQISQKLFFLSNKSQEQVSEEYKILSSEVAQLQQKLIVALE